MERDNSITVILPGISSDVWTGGGLYYSNLKQIVGSEFPSVRFAEYDTGFQPKVSEALGSRLRRKVFGKKYIEERNEIAEKYFYSLSGNRPAVIFSNAVIPACGRIPFIFWIPDFQFLHLADFASGAHIESAKKQVKIGAERATMIMLSSNDALKDLESFIPGLKYKVRVIPFAKRITPGFLDADFSVTVGKYNLPDKFFYMPNQFWKHKNHKIVIDALAILKKRGRPLFVVFSGNTADFRNPEHFSELLGYISSNNVRENIALLGVIPFSEVIGLMRASVSVLNASLFEGWSTTVEEVKSIGKPMLLSDLDVHKEQAPENAVFFRKNDADDLAEKMEQIWFTPSVLSSEEEKKTWEKSAARESEFAIKFRSLVDEAISFNLK